MKISEAKQIPIVSFLSSALSLHPQKEKPGEAWYLSPLHEEKTPSFKVDLQKNIWYDHGIGEGGTIIDLVIKLNGECSPGEALAILSNPSFSFSPAPVAPAQSETKKSEFEIIAVRDLRNSALLDYITKERGISPAIAKKFSNEIYFKKENSDKNLFAIAFKNDIGGYETRNALYKGNIGGKSITTIRGKGTGKVAVFEGFMDFLSVMTYYKMEEITDDVIVLNSLSLLSSAIEDLLKYEEVKLFLDNDKAGKEAGEEICKIHPKCVNYSRLYGNYKDANDWLIDIP